LQNKKLKVLFFALIVLLSTIFIIKLIQGYSPISNIYNAYYNSLNGFDINNSDYEVKLPFFHWKIKEKKDTSISLEGIKTEDGFLIAVLDNNFSSKSLQEISKMCEGRQKINKITISDYRGYDLFCKNDNFIKLKPYRIIFVPQKMFIFKYDYQIQYDNEYNKLISNVMLF